ncbi:MAG: hypothetical protein R3B46_00650 [Phycisphaerales bacterium]
MQRDAVARVAVAEEDVVGAVVVEVADGGLGLCADEVLELDEAYIEDLPFEECAASASGDASRLARTRLRSSTSVRWSPLMSPMLETAHEDRTTLRSPTPTTPEASISAMQLLPAWAGAVMMAVRMRRGAIRLVGFAFGGSVCRVWVGPDGSARPSGVLRISVPCGRWRE